MARNQAAQVAQAGLLLPLDADDYLGPNTVERFMAAWQNEPNTFLYPSVGMFDDSGVNVVIEPTPYDFDHLLYACFLLVGNLHRKSDWQKAGGWKAQMVAGFEDWEYWINFGRLGICGKPVKDALYYYRKNPYGRSASLRANPDMGQATTRALREIHRDLYEGRKPAMCCGRNRVAPVEQVPEAGSGAQSFAAPLPGAEAGLTAIEYLLQDEALTPWYGAVTKQRYMVSHSRPVVYVDARDLRTGDTRNPGLLEMWDNRQQVFRLYVPPQAPEPVSFAAPEPVSIPQAEAMAETSVVVTVTDNPPVKTHRKPGRKAAKSA
jgi:hypothetical protein